MLSTCILALLLLGFVPAQADFSGLCNVSSAYQGSTPVQLDNVSTTCDGMLADFNASVFSVTGSGANFSACAGEWEVAYNFYAFLCCSDYTSQCGMMDVNSSNSSNGCPQLSPVDIPQCVNVNCESEIQATMQGPSDPNCSVWQNLQSCVVGNSSCAAPSRLVSSLECEVNDICNATANATANASAPSAAPTTPTGNTTAPSAAPTPTGNATAPSATPATTQTVQTVTVVLKMQNVSESDKVSITGDIADSYGVKREDVTVTFTTERRHRAAGDVTVTVTIKVVGNAAAGEALKKAVVDTPPTWTELTKSNPTAGNKATAANANWAPTVSVKETAPSASSAGCLVVSAGIFLALAL